MSAALGWCAAPARADGDPASDVLATGPLFLPQDAGVPAAQQAQLDALVQEASRDGYPIRVALIASPTDLGSITELWKQPATYASFLGEELSLTYRGLLLVVMPDGFGLYHGGQSISGERSAIAGILVHPSGAPLAATALTAIQRLAAAAGHPLALPRGQTRTAAAPVDPTPWIVLAIGLLLIGVSWTASLRARPLRQPRSA